jgi:cytoskeletal protein CcmA (bactofilin family)
VVFRIYEAEEASATEVPLWSEQQTVTFDAGNFSVLLGAGKEYSSSEPYGNLSDVFDNAHVSEVSERYIGITVQGLDSSGTDSELVPRLRLLTSPYAFLATKALVADKLSTEHFSVDSSTGDVSIGKALNVSGAASFLSDIQVTGFDSTGDASVTGNLQATTLESTGNTTVGGMLSADDIHATGKLEVGETIESDGRVFIYSTQDVSGDNSKGSLFIGSETSANIGIDGNEIHARTWNSDTSSMEPDTLHLNVDGGDILMGGSSSDINVRGYLTVDNAVFESFNLQAYIDRNASVVNTDETRKDLPHSIAAASRIRAASYDVHSDARIKDINGRTEGDDSLSQIRQLKVTDYHFVDRISQGDAIQRGLIAQEVEKVLPEAVVRSTAVIPDIYSTSIACAFDHDGKTLTVRMDRAHGLKPNDVVRLLSESFQEEFSVLQTPSPTSFVVQCENPVEKVFVFGRQVDDFRSVDYDLVFTTGISALQELDRQVQALRKSEARVAELEAEVARVDSLEQEVKALKQLVAQLVEKQDEPQLTAQVDVRSEAN